MKFSNVILILKRELRDQLRDRRTIFTVAVLPLLLYPLLGMSFLQVAQFMKEHPTNVLVLGASELPAKPELLVFDDKKQTFVFSSRFCDDPALTKLVQLEVEMGYPVDVRGEGGNQRVLDLLEDREVDAVIVFPEGFENRVERYREITKNRPNDDDESAKPVAPKPQVFYDAARDKSKIALGRVNAVLESWKNGIVRDNLTERKVSMEAAEPFSVAQPTDVARPERKQASRWSRILPFVLLIWALTGAFYPAVDLCAGEKERGTLETLLCSPALRTEIVWGKLLAITVFSMATSILNLASMTATGTFIVSRLQSIGSGSPLDLGSPPIASLGWLLLALIPTAALFSALALAVAALARSTKEGQYYLMPLLLITMPLMILPLLPAAQLDLGNALIPVTGVMLLLRALMEGQYHDALIYVGPVLGVTAICCLLAIRWAVGQFRNESVLFRESEQWDMRLWVVHLVRDREDTPTLAMAVMCGLMLLLVRFFASLAAPPPTSFYDLARSTVILQIALIATPVLLMTIMLTRSPAKTLLLNLPRPVTRQSIVQLLVSIPAAILLAVAIHPVALVLMEAVTKVYEISDSTKAGLKPLSNMMLNANFGIVLLIFAALPAVCEELAFRGFILSGLRRSGAKWGAIVGSALFFGIIHGMLHQSINATALGMVIGFIAVQTGSLVPCIVFHFVHNSLVHLSTRVTAEVIADYPLLRHLYVQVDGPDEHIYSPWVVTVGGLLTIGLLLFFRSLPCRMTEEEGLRRVIDQQRVQAGA
jgi:sodium transport system permease protein